MKKSLYQSFNAILNPLLSTHGIRSILVAVSGGSDSMALLHLLHQAKASKLFELQVIHLNHGLRGEASDRDEKLLQQCCLELDVPLHCKKVSMEEWQNVSGTGIEEKARNLRYAFFFQQLSLLNIDTLAVGHTQNDLLETMLFNLIRGTSPEKLSFLLPEFEPKRRILRPLLSFSKDSLLAFLHEHKHCFCVDESNLDESYTRNLLRNSLIPMMQEINPKLSLSLLRFRDILSLEQDCFTRSFHLLLKAPLWEDCLNQEAWIKIRRPLYLELHPAYQYRIIREARLACLGHTRDFYYQTLVSICKGIHQSVQFRYNDSYWCIWTKKNWVYFKKNEKE
jgi:tRNA(Ile)-lysidine synthase